MTDETTNLSDLTLEQLRKRASELDITGRSKMDADELAGAIASATVNEVPPGTPEETGRPELASIAESRAANRNPRRVGADN